MLTALRYFYLATIDDSDAAEPKAKKLKASHESSGSLAQLIDVLHGAADIVTTRNEELVQSAILSVAARAAKDLEQTKAVLDQVGEDPVLAKTGLPVFASTLRRLLDQQLIIINRYIARRRSEGAIG